MPKIELQGHTIDYTLRKSARAKRVSIRFDVARGFQIVYPIGMRQPSPSDVLLGKQAWVLKNLDKLQAYQERIQYESRYNQGATFLYFGEVLTLSLIESKDNGKASASLDENRLVVMLPRNFMGDASQIRAAVETFYREQAKRYLPQRVKELADRHGFVYHRVRIKNQKTRWGSCSAKRNLNFNMRLMMAPSEAIDSVIIHELCHLRVLNHSKAFWDLFEKHCPDYRKWQNWLKDNEHCLVF